MILPSSAAGFVYVVEKDAKSNEYAHYYVCPS
jgi:hypothetical protein